MSHGETCFLSQEPESKKDRLRSYKPLQTYILKCIHSKDFPKASAASLLSATVGSNPLSHGPLGDSYPNSARLTRVPTLWLPFYFIPTK